MNDSQAFELTIIGERINPGFKSTKALFDNSDLAGVQALAVRQAEAGASYLNVNIGARALTDPAFLAEAKTMKLAFEPKTADEIQQVLTEVLSTPPDVVARYKQISEH